MYITSSESSSNAVRDVADEALCLEAEPVRDKATLSNYITHKQCTGLSHTVSHTLTF